MVIMIYNMVNITFKTNLIIKINIIIIILNLNEIFLHNSH